MLLHEIWQLPFQTNLLDTGWIKPSVTQFPPTVEVPRIPPGVKYSTCYRCHAECSAVRLEQRCSISDDITRETTGLPRELPAYCTLSADVNPLFHIAGGLVVEEWC